MQKIKDIAKTFYKEKYLIFFLICWVFMLFVYFAMYAHGLVNQWDGIWEYDYYMAGKWSIAIGRWSWPFLDRLKMGLATEPLATLTSTALYAFGTAIAMFFINNKKKYSWRSLLCAFTFLSSASICISLSYRFMSATFGLAFLLSVMAVLVLSEIDKPVTSVLISGIVIALQMGLYQAYLGCVGFMLTVWILKGIINKQSDFKTIINQLIKAACSLICGGVIYFVLLKAILLLTHTAMESYKGAEGYSLMNVLTNLTSSIAKTYEVFRLYFFGLSYRISIFMRIPTFYYIVIVGIFLVVIVSFVVCLVIKCRKDIKSLIAGLVLFLIIPLSVNMVLLVATNADTSLQMTVPMAMVMPVAICLVSNVLFKKDNGIKKALNILLHSLFTIVIAFLLYGSVMQVQVDQEAMRCGIESVTTIADGMLSELQDEDCLNVDNTVCFIGVPAGNELYYLPKACDGANYYALFGSWSGWSDSASWQGVYHNLLGVNVNVADNGQYEYIKSLPEVAEMPCYPANGCIKELNGIIVVKVSDAY